MLRLVDVRTGRVIGRTRNWTYPELGTAPELLANDSAALKTVFVNATRPLVAAGLKELGLIEPVDTLRRAASWKGRLPDAPFAGRRER